MNKKIVALLKMLALVLAGILLFSQKDKMENSSNTKESSLYDFAMGTSISITIYDGSKDLGPTIMSSIKELDTGVISWRDSDSEIYTLNNTYETASAFELSEELYTILEQTLLVCNDSYGALDITMRPLADLWNIEAATEDTFTVPSIQKINETMSNIGFEHISLESDVLIIDCPNIILDLGAVGKGYALDASRRILEDSGCKGAVISVGGSVMVYGSKSDGSDWRIGIRNPKGNIDEMIGYIELAPDTDICVSTSGDYEKYFLVDGVNYHHILDRRTGAPAQSGLSGVTVVCENGLHSDALSTACFVLGYEASLELLEKYNAEAIFIDDDNNITVTDGLKDYFIEN